MPDALPVDVLQTQRHRPRTTGCATAGSGTRRNRTGNAVYNVPYLRGRAPPRLSGERFTKRERFTLMDGGIKMLVVAGTAACATGVINT